MRWYGNRDSAEAGEASVLALVETVVAMSGTVAVGVIWGSWWHVFVAAMVAPLMLLRTPETSLMGWSKALQYLERRKHGRRARHMSVPKAIGLLISLFLLYMALYAWKPPRELLSFPNSLYFLVMLAVIVPATYTLEEENLAYVVYARLWAAIVGACTKPVAALQAIPGNWWRIVGALDFMQSPELLPFPGKEMHPSLDRYGFLRDAWAVLRFPGGGHRSRNPLPEDPGLRWLSWPGRVITVVIPAVITRLSIKSTALVWLPLLWVLSPPASREEPLRPQLEVMARSDLGRAGFIWSFVYLLALLAKYAFFVTENALATAIGPWTDLLGERLAAFVTAFVRPGAFPIWQLASGLNSLLAIIAFLLIRRWRLRLSVGLGASEGTVRSTLFGLVGVRKVITTYTLLCNAITLYHVAQNLPVPKVGSHFFPAI